MSISLRIKDLMSVKKMSTPVFEKKIGVGNKTINNIVAEKVKISGSVLEKLLQTYPDVDANWLITGQGSMYRQTGSISAKGIPLVNAKAIGGFGNANFTIEERDVKEHYVIPKFKYKKIDFMIEVEGSSMYPKYNSGDVVACTIILESSFIQWNKTHVIATKEQGILIKRIRKSTKKECLLMVSDNKDYDHFDVPMSEITGIALVAGVIRLE